MARGRAIMDLAESLEADTFFRGREVGIFGGIDYQLPNQKTRVVAEYNPDLYSRETRGGAEPPKTELSYGVYHEFLAGSQPWCFLSAWHGIWASPQCGFEHKAVRAAV